jgi:hypothetical protein
MFSQPPPYEPPPYEPHRYGIPAPDVEFDSSPYVCIKLSEAWIPIVLGALRALIWEFDYDGEETEQIFASEEGKRLLAAFSHGNLMCVGDIMYLLRQSPSDPCQLEQSIDNGQTWTPAFNFRLCLSSKKTFTDPESQAVMGATATAIANVINTYGGDPLVVFTDGAFDQSPDDEFRNGAMCYALNLLLVFLSKMVSDNIDNGTDWWDVAHFVAEALQYTGELILAVGGSALVEAGPQYALAVAAVTVAARYAKQFVEDQQRQPDWTPILSSDAQQALICCAMGTLQGNTPSLGLFSAMFTGCDVPELNADVVALLEYVTESEEVYIAFLDMCQQGFTAIDGGQSFSCGCGDDMIAQDFTAESGSEPGVSYGLGNWVLGDPRAGCGVYSQNVGIVAGNQTSSNWYKQRGVSVTHHSVTGTISRVRAKFDIEWSNYVQLDPGKIGYGGDERSFSIAEVGLGTDRWIERVASRSLSSDPLKFELFCYIRGTDNPVYAGNVVLKRIEIYGSGLSWA